MTALSCHPELGGRWAYQAFYLPDPPCRRWGLHPQSQPGPHASQASSLGLLPLPQRVQGWGWAGPAVLRSQ